jgi:hypothetical protein
MRKIFLAIVILFALGCSAQQIDILNTQTGPIRTLARNVNWNASGSGGLQNNFIFTPLFTNESVCLQIKNTDPTNAETAQFAVYGAEDQQVTSYASQSAYWSLLGPVAGVPQGALTVAAASSRNFFIQIAGQARVAIVFAVVSNTTSNNATLLAIESQQSNGCGNIQTVPTACPYSRAATVASGATSQIVTVSGSGQSAGQAGYICNLFVASTVAATPALNGIVLEAGPGTGCPTSPITLAEYAVSANPVLLNLRGEPLVGRFGGSGSGGQPADLANDNICVVNNSGVSVEVSYTYNIF